MFAFFSVICTIIHKYKLILQNYKMFICFKTWDFYWSFDFHLLKLGIYLIQFFNSSFFSFMFVNQNKWKFYDNIIDSRVKL